jgi:DNA topoisomerase I
MMTLEDITLEIALDLLKLPRDLGIHPETGGKLQVNLRSFGSYIIHDRGKEGKEYQSIKAPDNILTITLERAIEVLAASRLSRSNRR